jgi:hypothetical protein
MRVGQLGAITQMTGREGRAFGHAAGEISAGVRPALRGLVGASRARNGKTEDADAKEFHARPLALPRRCRIATFYTGSIFCHTGEGLCQNPA